MPITAILGEQRGDEGKGRYVDMLMPDYDIGARFNGGDNAGHTVVAPDGEVYKLHGLPTSIVHPHATSVIGNGVALNPVKLNEEIEQLQTQGIEIHEGNLLISGGSHFTLPSYIMEDSRQESGTKAQGSTKAGIAQNYSAKVRRHGMRADTIKHQPDVLRETVLETLRIERREQGLDAGVYEEDRKLTAEFMEQAAKLARFITDTAHYLDLQLALERPARILAEGAQAYLLDVDHGMYPAVSSSTTTIGGVSSGLGIAAHRHIDKVIGVSKAVPSHVGGGPFVTEITDDSELLARLHGNKQAVDAEVGTTTGRTRRLGYYDIPIIRRSHMVNGTTEMAITKLDWVPRYGEEVKICTGYFRNGKILPRAVDSAHKMEAQVEPVYETLPTWSEDIQDVRDFEDLPEEAKEYIRFIEDKTRKAITLIGVGPQRDQVIDRRLDLRQ